MRAALALVLLAACGPAAPPTPPTGRDVQPPPRGPSSRPSHVDTPPPNPPPPSSALKLPASGDFTIPADWTACASDDDCTVASLGCCDNTPVNRAHHDALRQALDASGRRICPVKSACGPGPGGDWDGWRGLCTAKACAMPPWPK